MKVTSFYNVRSVWLGALLALAMSCWNSFAATTHVSGGGAALATAVGAAASGDEIVVDDSLDYSPLTLTTANLYIHAAGGQTPRVVSDITVNGGTALQVGSSGVNGSTWAGINLIQNVTGGGGGHNVLLVTRASGTLTMSNCIVSIDLGASGPGNVDARVAFIGAQLHAINVTFARADLNGNPCCWVGDGGGFSTFDNCTFGPSTAANGLLVNPDAGGTLTVNNCLFTGLSGGDGLFVADRPQTINLNGCTWAPGSFAIYAWGQNYGTNTVINLNKCKLGPARNNWLIFAGDGGGGVLNMTNSVIFCDSVQGALINGNAHSADRYLNNTFNFVNCTITETQPGGAPKSGRVLLALSGVSVASCDFENCLVNWPGSGNVAVVTSGGSTVNAGVNFINVGSSSGDSLGGTQLNGNPYVLNDGYHLAGFSPCIDAATSLTGTDIDGDARPFDSANDIGCDEAHKVNNILVSGGGAALQNAINSASAGYYIVVTDSQSYTPVTVGKALTIMAAPGVSPNPVVVADPTVNSGMAVSVTSAGATGSWNGIDVVQNSTASEPQHYVFQADGAYAISNCTISINLPSGSVNARVLGVGGASTLYNVTLTRNDSNSGNTLLRLYNTGGSSTLINCTIGPATAGPGINNVSTPGNQTLTVQNCLFTGLTTKGIGTYNNPQTWNITGSTFAAGTYAVYAANGAGAFGTIYNFNQCKLGPAPSDWLIFAGDASGTTLNFTNCVVFCDSTRQTLMQTENRTNTWQFIHCTFTETQPGGGSISSRQLIFVGATAAGSYTFRNCLVNWPASGNIALVYATAALPSPVVAGTNLVWVSSFSSADAFHGAGTEIAQNPLMQPDGYHLKGTSPAIDAGQPSLTFVDIDGTTRPLNNGFDIGAVEGLKSTVINVAGGGTALATAIASAQPGYDFIIQDSLNYGPIIITNTITVEAAPGQSPTVVANTSLNNGIAVQVTGTGTASTWRGINVVQNVVGGGAAHNVFEVDQGSGSTTFTLQNCAISINLPGSTVNARPLGLYNKTALSSVTVFRNDGTSAGILPVVGIYSNAQNSSFINCTIGPTYYGDGIEENATAGGTLTISNCVFAAPITNGYALDVKATRQTANVYKTTYAPRVSVLNQDATAALGCVFNWNQSYMGFAPEGKELVNAANDGIKFNFTNVVFYAGPVKISQLVNNGHSNTWNFVHCTATETQPGGSAVSGRKFLNIVLGAAPNYGPGTNGTYNFQNCIFNWPGSANVQIVAGAGLNIPHITAGTNLLWVGGLNASDSFSGVGTQITADPKMQSDGYHIISLSPAAGAGAPGFATVDIDGNTRPLSANGQPCIGATETGKGVLTLVSGGGAALQSAIDAANPYDWLLVTDSLDYSPVNIGKVLTILSTNSTHPRVVQSTGVNSDDAVFVHDAGDGGTWNGIDVVQNVGGGGGGHNVFFLANNSTKQVYTAENFTLAISTTDFVDARVSFWGNSVHLINVTAYRSDSGYANPILWFGDNCSSAQLDNCHVGPSSVGDSIVATASAAPNPGVVMNNTEFLTTSAGHRAITASDNTQKFYLNGCTIDPSLGGFYVGNSGSAPGTVFSLNACKIGPVPGSGSGWVAFAGDGSGSQIAFTNCVIFCDNNVGTLLHSSENGGQSNIWTFVHCTFTETQPGGVARNGRTLLNLGQANGTNSHVTVENCLFNWPGSSNTIVVNAAGLANPPVTAGVNLFWLPDPSTNANDACRGAGPEIFADPQMGSDGYTVGPLSPAVDAGLPGLTYTDLNGTTRPLNSGFDIGAVEVFRPAYVPPTVLSVTPANGSTNVIQSVAVGATIRDGTAAPDPTSFRIQLNGQIVTPSSSKNGTLTTVTYNQPGGLLGNTLYNVVLTFRDNSSPTPNSFTNSWSFTTAPPLDAGAPRLQDSTAQAVVAIETEHYNRNTAAGGSAWVQTNGVDSIDGIAMVPLPAVGRNVGANITSSPLLEYKVTFVTNGTHYIWVLGEGDSGSGTKQHDTCNIGLDGVLAANGTGVGGNFEFLGGFMWSDASQNLAAIASIEVPAAGEHILDLWMQKDGLLVDEIVLTTDPNYLPPGGNAIVTESPVNPAPPQLTMQKTPNGLVITWTGGGTLYSASVVTGPYSPVAGASGSININPTGPQHFYRVIR